MPVEVSNNLSVFIVFIIHYVILLLILNLITIIFYSLVIKGPPITVTFRNYFCYSYIIYLSPFILIYIFMLLNVFWSTANYYLPFAPFNGHLTCFYQFLRILRPDNFPLVCEREFHT